MSINGNGDTLTITGARLKVSGGVQVSGSIAYTDDATGFGGVSAQIDADNTTLNITAGKTSGVAKIERGTTTNITGINHANVSNNTTIHIALKNTSSNKGDFVTIGTFADDDTVKVNYTDEYVIGPGETGMLTLRKVAGVLSLFIREMFSSNATNTDTKPFYIKDGTDYKYPLYTSADNGGNLEGVTINGVQYYRPSSGLKTKTRPPLGIPELIVTSTPTGNLAIGNNGAGTTVNYDVWGVPSSFDFGSIYQGGTKKTIFILENGEASGSFTESGASSGDAYSLYVERTDLSTSDTVSFGGFTGTLAFHYGSFDTVYGDADVTEAANNGHIFDDTPSGTYDWGTLGTPSTASNQTTYTWTPSGTITGADVLMVAGGGGGGRRTGGGGGAGGLVFKPSESVNGQQTIVIGNGGTGATAQNSLGTQGKNTTFLGYTAFGGGAGSCDANQTQSVLNGGSGGGADWDVNTYGVASQPGSSTGGYGNNGGGADGDRVGGAGGGGAGTAGGTSTDDSGYGGDGLNEVIINGTLYNFSSIFGPSYGENISGEIWFAGGGGGGTYSGTHPSPIGGKGGGGDGSGGLTVGQAHTGGGGGGEGPDTANGKNGGSGIVLIKSPGIGKTIPKVTGASFDSTNVTFTVQGASNITNIKYTINGGSEQTTPVGTLAVAHGLSASASITVVAYAVDANGDQISAKKTVTGTIPLLFTNFPSTIAFTGWWNDEFSRWYQLTSNTDTFIQYELYDASGLVGAEYGSTFTLNSSGILFNVEDTGDTSTPYSYSNGGTFVGTSGIVEVGDSITLWNSTDGTGTAEAVFTVPNFFS
jgi:hypothetical protein